MTSDPTTSTVSNSPSCANHGSPSKTSNALPLTLGLVLACGAVGLYAAFGSSRDPESVGGPIALPAQEPTSERPPTPLAAPANAASLGGTVREVIQVSNYTYLHIDGSNGREFWAAVTKTEISKGSVVLLEGAHLMSGFESKELGRKFDEIYFANVSPGSASSQGAGVHARPHGIPGEVNAAEAVKTSEKAEGASGRTVAEIHAQAASLKGKMVRVRGTVVKVTRGVMGGNFLHLRDGSGAAQEGSHDLTIKLLEEPPELNSETLIEGTVAVDVDLGAGYAYPVLLDDARVPLK